MEEIRDQRLTANAPGEPWLVERALQVWRVWRDGSPDLELELEPYAAARR